jgi:flagellar motor protein MotB
LPGTAFASGSATLAPSAVASLRALFKAIGAKKKLRVEAHTDDQGSDSVNLALSQRRAEAVRRRWWRPNRRGAHHRRGARAKRHQSRTTAAPRGVRATGGSRSRWNSL